MKYYFPNVDGLGNVEISRHAQDQVNKYGISERDFEEALLRGETIEESPSVVRREKDGVRIIILNRPTPFRGAKLAMTTYRIGRPARVKKG